MTSQPVQAGSTANPASNLPAEAISLELTDQFGNTVGISEKIAAHTSPGLLHRAFSVFLFSTDGRLLLQRRSWTKYHWPGVWSNSCCGHPFPKETPFHAAARRTVQELGVDPALLMEAGTVTYDHTDTRSGLVEKEFNHLFVGLLGADPRPDPAEVAEVALVTPGELDERLKTDVFSAWFPDVLEAVRPAIRRLRGDHVW